MLGKLLYLRDGELSRLLPFFGLYALLFAAFALADGLTLALFLRHEGARALPQVYLIVGVVNLIVIAVYIALAERFRASLVFQVILAGNVVAFGAAWIALMSPDDDGEWYDVLFVCREIAFTLMLMHFGTFLQDYFTRDEMSRVLPLVYSGGRLGGVLGGALLEFLAEPLGLIHLLLVFVGICVVAIAALTVIDRVISHAPRETPVGEAPALDPLEEDARQSTAGFLRFVWQSPLLYWITITTLLFILCRWFLNFQYSNFLWTAFDDDEDLAEFLGRYTQGALLVAIIVQVLLVNRLIAWLGLKGAHLIYGVLLLVGMLLCVGEMTLSIAIFARFIETELRFGLRNPIHQLITNQFPKALRVRVRAWSFGVVIPVATVLSSLLIGGFLSESFAPWLAWLGAGCAAAYFLCTFGLLRSFHEQPRPAAI